MAEPRPPRRKKKAAASPKSYKAGASEPTKPAANPTDTVAKALKTNIKDMTSDMPDWIWAAPDKPGLWWFGGHGEMADSATIYHVTESCVYEPRWVCWIGPTPTAPPVPLKLDDECPSE